MQISLPGLALSENSIVFTHVDEARKANLHAYKRITIRPAIYEGLRSFRYKVVSLQVDSLHLKSFRYTSKVIYKNRVLLCTIHVVG